jgi:hypothetical protein
LIADGHTIVIKSKREFMFHLFIQKIKHMKKLMLTVAGLLIVSVMAANAQVTQDTTQTEQPPTEQPPTDQPTTDQPTESPNLAEDPNMEMIQSSDVPASLRSTLQGTEYAGWENGQVYRNKSTNEFIVQIGEDADKKTYTFDSNGKRVDE